MGKRKADREGKGNFTLDFVNYQSIFFDAGTCVLWSSHFSIDLFYFSRGTTLVVSYMRLAENLLNYMKSTVKKKISRCAIFLSVLGRCG